jgi:hypothetical protein
MNAQRPCDYASTQTSHTNRIETSWWSIGPHIAKSMENDARRLCFLMLAPIDEWKHQIVLLPSGLLDDDSTCAIHQSLQH